MDLDGDGRTDVISGSWPGEIYFFRRLANGAFAAGEQLKTKAGEPLNVGSGSAPFAFDWDGDGKPDLVVGAGDGSVVWFRNEGTAKEPTFAAAQALVPPSPSPVHDDRARRPTDWGTRVKPCVVDWDGDGRLDLLVGDLCGGCERPPMRTPEEATEAREADDRLPELRKEWAAAYKEYAAAPDPTTDAERRHVENLRVRVKRLKDEISRLADIRDRYQSGYMSHGYVWLFRRLPAEK